MTVHHEGEASVASTAITIISNVVGGGCLLLPSAFHEASLIPGIIGLVLMGFLAVASIFYMILCCEKTGRYTYKDLLTIAISPRAAFLFEIVLFLYTYLILVGWSRIIVDSMPPVAEQFFNLSADNAITSKWFWLLMAGIIFFPLSSMKALAHLKWSAAAGFATILYVALVMVGRLGDGFYTDKWNPKDTFRCASWNQSMYSLPPANSSEHFVPPQPGRIHDDLKIWDLTFQLVSAFPQFSVAYSCHYNIPPFYGELRRRSPMRMIRAAGAAYVTISTFYIVVGIVGELTFSSGITNSKGDVLKCYSWNDTPMNIGRVLMFIHFCMVYPIVAIACRRSVNALIFPGRQLAHWVLIVQALIIVVSGCVIAYFVPGIGIVFTLAGAFFGLAIVLIVPGLFYFRIFGDNYEQLLADAAQHQQQQEQQQQQQQQDVEKLSLTQNPGVQANSMHAIDRDGVHGTTTHQVEETPQSKNKFTVSDSVIREDQGYNTLSQTDVSPEQSLSGGGIMVGGAGGAGTTVAVSESIPTEWDMKIHQMIVNPSPWLRYLSVFSMVFGVAASVLSIVNAFRDIADGKSGG